MRHLRKIFAAAIVALGVLCASQVVAQNLNQPGGQLNNLNTASSFQGGVWLPQAATLTSASSLVMSGQSGTYEIIGRQVTVRFNAITATSTAGATGQLLLTGLPVVSASSSGDYGLCNLDMFGGITLDSGFGSLAGIISPGTSSVVFTESGTGKAPQALQIGNVNSTGGSLTLVGSCVYHSP